MTTEPVMDIAPPMHALRGGGKEVTDAVRRDAVALAAEMRTRTTSEICRDRYAFAVGFVRP